MHILPETKLTVSDQRPSNLKYDFLNKVFT